MSMEQKPNDPGAAAPVNASSSGASSVTPEQAVAAASAQAVTRQNWLILGALALAFFVVLLKRK